LQGGRQGAKVNGQIAMKLAIRDSNILKQTVSNEVDRTGRFQSHLRPGLACKQAFFFSDADVRAQPTHPHQKKSERAAGATLKWPCRPYSISCPFDYSVLASSLPVIVKGNNENIQALE
jgi:hypothetical protein